MVTIMMETGERLKEHLLEIQRTCFICGVSTIPIMTGRLKFPVAGNYLAYVFIIMGVIAFFIESYIYPNSLTEFEKKIIGFLKIVFFWALLCSVLGVLFYPSFANIDLNQMRIFKNLFYNLQHLYPEISELFFLKSWLLYRAIRNSIAYTTSSFLISFWIYHIYYQDWKKGLQDFKKSLVIASLFLITYSVVEVGFLCGSPFCKDILAMINVRIFDVASGQGWWPPLFWDRLQLRSLFPEPSHLGIFLAMAIPPFFTEFFNRTKAPSVLKIFIYCCLIIMLFMSKARTGNVVVGIELLLFLCWACICAPFVQKEKYKRICLFIGCTALAFFISLGIMSNFRSIDSKVADSHEVISAKEYVRNNVTSVTGNKRSNSARKVNALATLKVGAKHPLFGVGIYMRNEYINAQLTDEDKNVGEVKLWLKYMVDAGPIQSGFPDTNHILTIFAEQGIIGLILFIYPACALLVKVFRKWKAISKNEKIMATIITFLGLNIALLANEDHFGIFIVLGLMMAIFWKKEEAQYLGRKN